MKRDLTPEEEAFIEQTLSKKKVVYNEKENRFVEKKKKSSSRVKNVLWTLFRPRNWSVAVIAVSGFFLFFVISMIQSAEKFLSTGILQYFNSKDVPASDLESFAKQTGISVESIQKLLYYYDNRALYIAAIISITIVLVVILFIVDILIQNKKIKNQR